MEIEAAGSVPAPSDGEGASARRQLGGALREALAGKAGRATTLVGVSRSQVELVSLTLPPAADAELPEMVRNQAVRENNAIGDDAIIDFVPLGDKADEPRQVTAVALAQARLEQIQGVLSDAGVTARSIALRPYATAALVAGALADRDQTCLVINVLAEEVDLIVLSGGRVAYWRTLRQAGASHDAAAARRLMAEAARTLVVSASQVSGRPLEAVYLCGGLDEHPALVEAARGQLPLAVTLVDPFAAQGLAAPPENPGRFASLVGMLTVEAGGGRQAIDFLAPRKRPAPPDRRRTYALAAAAASLVVLLGGYQAWSTFSALDEQIATLSAELDRLDEQMKYAEKRQKAIAAIGGWTKNDVNWLDELRDLSLRFPGGRDAMVLRMSLGQGRDSGGSIDMTGIVRDPIVVSHIEQQLRDDHHQISSRHMQQRERENNYTWHFESSLVVSPRQPDEYVSHVPPAEQPEVKSAPQAVKAAAASTTGGRKTP